jgi:hypothetical protein
MFDYVDTSKSFFDITKQPIQEDMLSMFGVTNGQFYLDNKL